MKKGFTLIELLAVIVILGIVALIATPAVINVLNNSKTKLDESQKKVLLSAVRNWGAKKLSVDENGVPSQSCVTIKKLKDDKYLESKNIQNVDDNYSYTITWENNQFVYTLEEETGKCDN